MYIASGKLTVRHRPEALVGKWAYREQTNYANVRVVGGKRSAAFFVGLLKMARLAPSWAAAEHIGSLEQAQRYVDDGTRAVTVVRFRKFDATEALEQHVPKGTELVSAEGGLWRERRVPTPVVYFLGHRTLLEAVEYDQQSGWQRDSEPSPTAQTQIGLMTPVLSLSATATFRN